MSGTADDREGLSPLPMNLADILTTDDDDDDDLYEPATERSEMTASTAEDEDDIEFTGTLGSYRSSMATLTPGRRSRAAQRPRDRVRWLWGR
jgi:hypothetical protein